MAEGGGSTEPLELVVKVREGARAESPGSEAAVRPTQPMVRLTLLVYPGTQNQQGEEVQFRVKPHTRLQKVSRTRHQSTHSREPVKRL